MNRKWVTREELKTQYPPAAYESRFDANDMSSDERLANLPDFSGDIASIGHPVPKDWLDDYRKLKLHTDGVLGRCFGFDYDGEEDVKTFTQNPNLVQRYPVRDTFAEAARKDADRFVLAATFLAGMAVGAIAILLIAYFIYGGY